MDMPDGVPLSGAAAGVANFVKLVSVNWVQAANTLSAQRETMEQRVIYTVTPAGTIEINVEWIALEAVRVVTDNGPQIFSVGYQSGALMFYGKSNERQAFTNAIDSGATASSPGVWAVAFRDSESGDLLSWMDRSFEAGDGRYVAAASPFIRGGNASGSNPANTKFYNAAVAGVEAVLAAGESYEWRGGWAHRPASIPASGFDAIATYSQDGKLGVAVIGDGGLSM